MGKLTYKMVQRKNPIDKTLKWYPQATRYTTIGKEEVLRRIDVALPLMK